MRDDLEYEVTIFSAMFKWTKDKFPSWRLLKNAPYEGDCEDYAMTVAWLVAERSKLRLMWHVLTWQSVFWFGLSRGGRNPHTFLWNHGRGWIDNIFPQWSSVCRHTRIMPFNIIPYVFLAFGIYGAF